MATKSSKPCRGSGLWGKALRFEAFVRLMMGQARAEHRLRSAQERRARLGGSTSP